MTDKLREIAERLRNATPGEWKVDSSGLGKGGPEDRVTIETVRPGGGNVIAKMNVMMPWQDDANFIAHAPTDIAFLLSALRRMEGEKETLLTMLDTKTIPADIVARMQAVGKLDWGAIAAKPDAEHVSDFAESLRVTRENFNIKGDQSLHGAYVTGSETVVCHTGTSPNSAVHAQIIVGLWNSVLDAFARAALAKGAT